MSGKAGGRFLPEPGTVYRLFFLEMEDGRERLKQVVGRVTLYEDGSALVEPDGGKPSTFVRSYEKLVEYVPSERDGNGEPA